MSLTPFLKFSKKPREGVFRSEVVKHTSNRENKIFTIFPHHEVRLKASEALLKYFNMVDSI